MKTTQELMQIFVDLLIANGPDSKIVLDFIKEHETNLDFAKKSKELCPFCKTPMDIIGPETENSTACLMCPNCWYEEGGAEKEDENPEKTNW